MFTKSFLLALLATLGCVLGNSLISRRSYPMVGTNHCTWGPSYWCSHISKAKECGTLKHCAAVWGQQQLNGHNEICETCEYFVSGAHKLQAKNITQKSIGFYMDTMCYQLSGKELKDKCLGDISQYLTEVLQLLDLGLTQRAVCYAINLCPQQKPHETTVNSLNTTTTTPTPTTTKHSNKVCHDCQEFFKDVRQRLQSNATVKNVEDLFDSTICVALGPFRDMCRQLIDAFVPMYLADVSELIDPGFLCSVLSFCPESQKSALFEALSQKSLVSAHMMITDAKTCSNCKDFITNIKTEIDSDTTVDKLKAVLEKDVCDHLGDYKSVCHLAVETYAKEILQDLLNDVDASMICHKLGLCDAYAMNALIVHLKAVKFSSPNPFQESTECELCKVLLSELHSLVEDKQVQVAVRDFINNEVCVRLGDMKDACLMLVKEYEPLIMKALQGLLDPDSGCAMLGMCSNSSEPKNVAKSSIVSTVPLGLLTPAAAFIPYQRVGLVLPPKTEIKTSQSEQCTLCKMVMGELEKVLKDRTVEKDIEAALDEVCSILPRSMSKQCADFVNEYTPGIIELILSQLDPKMVCSALQLCPSVSVPVPDANGCSYCSEILGIASGHLATKPNMTKKEFEDMLLEVCKKFGEQFKYMCAPGVQQFGDTVYKALKSDMAPREVCGMIGLCASSAIKPETKHYLGVMCELLRSAGVTTQCKEFTEISKEISNNFLTVLLKKTGPKETNALKIKSGGITCSDCTNVINYIRAFVVDKDNEEELRKMLHKVCHYMEPASLSKECDVIVNQYEELLILLLGQNFPAKQVCETLKLCPKSSNTLYFKPSHHNSCDLGIHYWCSSYAAAVKCKAIGICSTKVWKKKN